MGERPPASGGPAASGALAGRSVVVIGATSGIGAATARLAVEAGATVLCAGRRVARGEAVVAELGPRAEFRRADISVEADVEALIALALERHGRLDGLVNCAGESLPGGPIAEADVAEFEALVGRLAGGALAVTKHGARAMLPQSRGSIVHLGSFAAHAGGWSSAAYSAGKAALTQLVRSAAVELGESGVRVNSVCPGPILTGIFAKAAGMEAEEADEATLPEAAFREGVARWQALNRVGRADDVAAACVWLLSDAASFVNGIDLPVDGGIGAGRPASVGLPARAAMAAAFRPAGS